MSISSRPIDLFMDGGVEGLVDGGVHKSWRCVKCQDHAWEMLSKLKGSPDFEKLF